MIAVLLALAGAASYGVSDFVGGLVSRRTTVWPVASLACLGALLGSVGLALVVPGDPSPADFGWAAIAGVGSGLGTAFLYRGLARGRMGVVAPVSAVGAAVIPVVIGVLTGERPSALVWLGIVAAAPGIWLTAREEDGVLDAGPAGPSGLADGVLAGVGFGVLFAALGQVPTSAGYWPLSLDQATSLVAVTVAGVLLGGRMPLPRRAVELWGLASGVLASLAVVCFLIATDHGLLSVSAVLTSLYPATTVLLAAVVLRERIHRVQSLGLLCCALSVCCVALG